MIPIVPTHISLYAKPSISNLSTNHEIPTDLEDQSLTSDRGHGSNTDWQNTKRLGITPSQHLRRHFVALARRIKHWSSPVQRPVKIGVTSLDRKVGKSTIAFNLAAALARIEVDRVLLVESDFGKHFISRRLGSGGSPGLSEIISSAVEPSECILSTPINRLSVLGSGHISEQESVEMPFDRLGPVLEEDFSQFGYLVFDLPVASDLTSCYSLLPHIDGVVIAVEADKIDQKQIARAKNRIAQSGADLVGLIINRA